MVSRERFQFPSASDSHSRALISHTIALSGKSPDPSSSLLESLDLSSNNKLSVRLPQIIRTRKTLDCVNNHCSMMDFVEEVACRLHTIPEIIKEFIKMMRI